MSLFLTVVHVMACIVLIVVVLLQRGKGAEMGAVFGGGGSNTVFGSRGAASFLSKLTTGCTVIFFITSLSLAYIASRTQSGLFTKGAAEESKPASTEAAKPQASESETGGFSEIPAATPSAEESATPSSAEPSATEPTVEPSAAAPDSKSNAAPSEGN